MKMSKATEIEALRLLIKQDEQALTSLKAQETEIIEHVAPRGFQAATNRERVMSEAQIIEERLHKNRKRLSALEH
jgi:hypothetical protein